MQQFGDAGVHEPQTDAHGLFGRTDRARLDQAMAHLLSGLRKPEFHRYGREMLALKLDVMGSRPRLLQRIERIALCASALLPDLSKLRDLARMFGEHLVDQRFQDIRSRFLEQPASGGE